MVDCVEPFNVRDQIFWVSQLLRLHEVVRFDFQEQIFRIAAVIPQIHLHSVAVVDEGVEAEDHAEPYHSVARFRGDVVEGFDRALEAQIGDGNARDVLHDEQVGPVHPGADPPIERLVHVGRTVQVVGYFPELWLISFHHP